MHRLARQRLEEFLSAPDLRLPAELEQHLAGCEECRREWRLFADQAQWLQLLGAGERVQPAPGFYARVLHRIETQQRGSLWNVFLEPVFGWRMVIAMLTLTLAVGSVLAFREGDNADAAPAPEAIMAVEDHPPGLGTDLQRDRETILVTLASYRE